MEKSSNKLVDLSVSFAVEFLNKGQMHFCQTTRPITKFGTLTITSVTFL